MRAHISFKNADPNLEARVVREIGRVIVRWSRFENLLHWDIMAMMEHPAAKREEIFLSFERRLGQWKKLNDRLYKDQPAYIAAARVIARDALVCSRRRNPIAHGIWGNATDLPDRFTIITVKPDRKTKALTYTEHSFHWDDLRDLSDTIMNLYDRAARYLQSRASAGHLPTNPRGLAERR